MNFKIKLKNKNAQLQLSETIFVVFFIIAIILFAFIFYYRAKESSLVEDQNQARVLRLVALAHDLSSWPELECSVLESRDFDCLDRIKLDIAQDVIASSKSTNTFAFNYYADFLKRSKIVVTEVYSYDSSGLDSWIVYNTSLTGTTHEAVTIPVNVYDPVKKTYTLALMELTIYE